MGRNFVSAISEIRLGKKQKYFNTIYDIKHAALLEIGEMIA